MCGIAGFFGPSLPLQQAEALSRRMGDQLLHRGPDAGAIWCDATEGLGLAHRRLSIVDLSPAGAQPMVSHCGRYVLTYNGEVYNSADLRAALAAEGHQPAWHGHSDTETIVEACAVWGVGQTVNRLIGMFAFALWDRHEKTLVLVRDRLGVKPLYWGRAGRTVVFGSELKALMAHDDWAPRVNRAALARFLRFGYVQGSDSIYDSVRHVMPGCMVTFSGSDRAPVEAAYWTLGDVIAAGVQAPRLSDAEAIDRLETLLRDAVQRRMVADVPLGAFLSGGIDSSLVALLMQQASDRPVRTFSIGFESADFDESHHAAAVAKALGSDHTELRVTDAHARDVVPRLATMFDEPFADSSQIPTYLVSEMTRQHVTVALSGDGGDELFAGYTRYLAGHRLWQRFGGWPLGVRRTLAAGLDAVPPSWWSAAFGVLPVRHRPFAPADRVSKVASLLRSGSLDDVHLALASQWQVPPTADGRDCGFDISERALQAAPSGVPRMQAIDQLSYLADDILTKVDRASMAVALEARVPLLDHRVVEFSWSLPMDQKIRHGQGKWLLRQVLHRHLPEMLFDRPKQGFAAPIADWLRGPLREWAESLLDEQRLRDGGALDVRAVRMAWDQHVRGVRNHTQALWTVLMWQQWAEQYKPVW